MNNIVYELLLPTAAEPQNGFGPSSQIDFLMNHPGKVLNEQCLRFTGTLNVSNSGVALANTDIVSMNPNGGAHTLLNHLIIMFDNDQVELNTEYARFVSAEEEAKSSCLELGAKSDDICELKSVSQDGNKNSLTGSYIHGDYTSTATQSSIPFSILLRCCLNKSSSPIPFNKTGPVRIRMILRQPTDVFYAPEIAIANLSYTVSNVCLRYTTSPDYGVHDKTIMERIQYTGQQSLLSSYNTFSTICPTSFHSMILLFRNTAHVNNTNFTYDPVLNEGIQEPGSTATIPNYVEYTLMGGDTPLSFPLRTGEEMLTNYLLSHNKDLLKHGLNYTKLNNLNQSCGWGLGCNFAGELQSMPVQTTINFSQVQTQKYNVYIFYKGFMVL